MIEVFIIGIIYMLLVIGLIYNLYENRYKADLLSGDETEKLRKLGIEKLELERYAKTYFPSRSGGMTKRQLIPLNSYDHKKASGFIGVSDYLEVTGYKKKIPHTVYKCPYSPENKEKLLAFVESYNN
ncbi:MAG: hypothetical protein IKZ86_01295 [Spirochaetaceae bacterium]|nr:hypothetical protein [Spirochaetaceae bacterium]